MIASMTSLPMSSIIDDPVDYGNHFQWLGSGEGDWRERSNERVDRQPAKATEKRVYKALDEKRNWTPKKYCHQLGPVISRVLSTHF